MIAIFPQVVYLKQALGVAESLGAPVACASVLSNLGAALAASDPAAAVATLEKSVMLREQEVGDQYACVQDV